uniref:Helicase ATP-binding domain-containing protein n=1 Tax=viral metagenome TaxID=1070528 RepID=A0A6C0JQM9_9ZZZZ
MANKTTMTKSASNKKSTAAKKKPTAITPKKETKAGKKQTVAKKGPAMGKKQPAKKEPVDDILEETKECQKCHKVLEIIEFMKDEKEMSCCQKCISKYLKQTNNFWVQYPDLEEMATVESIQDHPRLTVNSPQEIDLTCPECNDTFTTSPKEILQDGNCPTCKTFLIPLDKEKMKTICIEKIIESSDYDAYVDSIIDSRFKSHELGYIQEVFAHLYFNIHAHLFNLKTYFSYSIPDKQQDKKEITKKLGMCATDKGTDAVLIHKDDEISLVQVKWRSKDTTLDRSVFGGMAIDGLSCKATVKHLYLFSNTSTVSKSSPNTFKYILYSDLASMDWKFFKAGASGFLTKGKKIDVIPVKDEKPRKWQEDSNEFAEEHKPRCIICAACGAGKTRAAIAMIKKKHKKVLIVVPSLQLLSQWFYNAGNRLKKSVFLLVGSQHAEDKDDVPYTLTTDVDTIRTMFEEQAEENFQLITICTYHSLPVLMEGFDEADSFSLTFCDEAHLTTGKGNWNLVTQKDFSSDQTIFLTATPKIYKGQLKETVISMDNEEVYGPMFTFSCREAIDVGILNDYKIVLGMSEQIQEGFPERTQLYTNFLCLCIKKYDLQRILVASNSHASSAKFYTEFKKSFRGPHRLVLMKPSATARDKNNVLSEIHKGPIIIFNVRVFTLGTDMPALDTVFFNGDKNSKVDIVQTSMRCMRIYPEKECSYIIVPSFFGDSLEVKDEGDYINVRTTLAALGNQDEMLHEEILQKSKTAKNGVKKVNKKQIIEIIGIDDGEEIIIDDLDTRLFDRLGNDVDDIRLPIMFDILINAIKENGGWIPHQFEKDGFKIGGFQSNLKSAITGRPIFKNFWPKWLKRLEKLPFWPEMLKQLERNIENRNKERKTPDELFNMLFEIIKENKDWVYIKDDELRVFQGQLKGAITEKNNRFPNFWPKWLKRLEKLPFWPNMLKQLNNHKKENKTSNELFVMLLDAIKENKDWVSQKFIKDDSKIGIFQDNLKGAITRRNNMYKDDWPKWLKQLEELPFWPEMLKRLDKIVKNRQKEKKNPDETFNMLITAIKENKGWIPKNYMKDNVKLGIFQGNLKNALKGQSKQYKTYLPNWRKRLEELTFWPEMLKQLQK